MSIDWVSKAARLNPKIRNFIDGQWREIGGQPLEKFGPRDGRLLYTLGSGDVHEIDRAVAAARRAFDAGEWSRSSAQHRREVLTQLAALMERNREELALLECLDVGKPINDALTYDVPTAAAIIRFNAEAADKFYGKVFGADRTSLSYQLRRPMGVVAGIVGWNFPLMLAAGKIGPALATGNSLVLKPSELTSLTASRIAELAVEAGLPPGVFNVVHGNGVAGEALGRHPEIDLISFTGSSLTGKKLLVASGLSNMKRSILECGGKAPNIVFDDSPDLNAVAESVVARAFWNQGQVCSASSRLLIQSGIKDELLSIILHKLAAVTPGDPLKMDTTFGALVSEGHRRKVLSYIDSGHSEGARPIFQSRASSPLAGGFYVGPTVFDDVKPNHRIAREEIFGPVLSVMTFRNEQEAIDIANSTIYGLSATMWTRDLGRALRVTNAISVGYMTVNATEKPTGGPAEGVLGIGGHKESGIGVEGGTEGLEAYTSQTAVQMFV